MFRTLARLNAALARLGQKAAVGGLWLIVAAVAYQVFGRYVLNDTPTWAESATLVMILYVALIGAAVGVRDAGHIGMESLLVLVPERVRNAMEFVIHALVGTFGALMIWNGVGLMEEVVDYKIPTLGISEGWHYGALPLSGTLILLFSLEHIWALARHEDVTPAWH